MSTMKALQAGLAALWLFGAISCTDDPAGTGPGNNFGIVTDIDGNVYKTVRIGNQVWMAENLRVTRYNDGSAIPHVANSAAWSALNTPGYCYYENATHPDTIKKWGALYNWFVVSPENPQKIAPAGWHVPTDSEWTVMNYYLRANGYNWDKTFEEEKVAKALAAKTDWDTCTIIGAIGCDLTKNDSTGFSALPGGSRVDHGDFHRQSSYGFWWCVTEDGENNAWNYLLFYDTDYLFRIIDQKRSGFSVRLIRD